MSTKKIKPLKNFQSSAYGALYYNVSRLIYKIKPLFYSIFYKIVVEYY